MLRIKHCITFFFPIVIHIYIIHHVFYCINLEKDFIVCVNNHVTFKMCVCNLGICMNINGLYFSMYTNNTITKKNTTYLMHCTISCIESTYIMHSKVGVLLAHHLSTEIKINR